MFQFKVRKPLFRPRTLRKTGQGTKKMLKSNMIYGYFSF